MARSSPLAKCSVRMLTPVKIAAVHVGHAKQGRLRVSFTVRI